MKRYSKIIFLITMLIIFVGCSKKTIEDSVGETNIKEPVKEHIPMADIEPAKSNKELETKINEFIYNKGEGYYDNVGIVFYDIEKNETIDINGDKEFFGASTYKVLMNIAAYEYVLNGEVSLDDYITYTEADFEEGGSQVDGGSYTLQELLDYSILYSDNIASNMIWRYLGGYTRVMLKAGGTIGAEVSGIGNIETANNLTKALKYIYDNRDNEHYGHLIDVMTKTIYHDRLDKYVAQDKVAHKVGMYDEYIHDVGIFLLDKPYILSVFTKDLPDSYDFIADLSLLIYNYRK